MKLKPALISGIAALLLGGCSISLAADVTPPPDFSPTQPVDRPAALQTALPMVPPDPANGAAIYADKCAPCHGTTGLSDGPMAEQLPQPAPALGDPSVARAAQPADWFAMVTNGNLERLMPGFSGSLSERERWDVVAYALTLHTTQASLAQGKVIFEQQCQSCHGDQGEGDGPESGGSAPDWKSDQTRTFNASNQELWEVINAGLPPSMPAFGAQLDEDELWAVTTYVRSLTFASQDNGLVAQQETPAGTQAEAETAEATEAAPAGTLDGLANVSGTVENASGGELPANLEVTLVGYDDMTEATRQTSPVTADGSFQFQDVAAIPERVYLASVDYGGVTYNADVIHPEQLLTGQDVSGLTIQLYDTTTDSSALRAERMHVFFEQTDTGSVQVVQLFILNNQGQKVIVPAGEDQPVMEFDLPEGATNLQFQDGVLGQSYIATENGFGDLHTFMPGAGAQLMFAYELPLERKATMTLEVPIAVDAAVFMVQVDGLNVSGDQISPTGQRDMQGVELNLYTAGSLQPGDALDVTVSTVPAAAGLLQNPATVGILAGVVGLGLILLMAGVYLMRKRQSTAADEQDEIISEAEDTEEGLLDAIITLDDQFRAGQLPEDAYHQRRAELKERLRSLQQESQD